jgi:hypothetical protein
MIPRREACPPGNYPDEGVEIERTQNRPEGAQINVSEKVTVATVV